MARYLLVSKELIFKILLTSVAVCVSYEYGYHPSAEEFDNLMRETRKTWTGDLLANERRRATTWIYPSLSLKRHESPVKYFPKFSYEKEHNRYETSVHFNWPKPVNDDAQQPIVNVPPVLNDRYDQPSAPSILAAPSNIASTLDFTMFSDEVQLSEPHAASVEQTPFVPENNLAESVFAPSGTGAQSSVNLKKEPLRSTTKLPEIYKIPSDPFYNDNNSSTPVLYNNHSTVSQLPIFFTNPATGIVYAITEVGKVQDNVTLSNDSIPIYITKQQYDRDLFLQRKYYEHRCRIQHNDTHKIPTNNSSSPSAISTSFSTTMRPQIIRLQKPVASNIVTKVPTAKVPSINKPSPVLVQSSINIAESANSPTRKKRPKVPKRRKKKPKKRPGRKSPASRSQTKTSPEIIVGKRPTEQPTDGIERLSTQLEKPTASMPATIFSDRPLVSIRKTIEPSPIHRIRRRSATNWRSVRNSKFLGHNFAVTAQNAEHLNMWQPVSLEKNLLPRSLTSTESRGTKKATKPTRPVREISTTSSKLVNSSNKNSIKSVRKKVSKKSPKTTTTKPPYANVAFVEKPTTTKVELGSAKPTRALPKATKRSRTKAKKRKKSQRKAEGAGDYDYFNLFGNNEDEDDDDEDTDEDEDDDDDDENDDDYGDVNSQATLQDEDEDVFYSNDKMTIDNNDSYPQYSLERDEITDPNTDLKLDTTLQSSSSIEQTPDYGGNLYVSSENSYTSTSAEDTTSGSSEKTKSGKKRTRRRPSSHRQPDYYDDDEYDGGDGSGLNGFIRMLFYPVQLIMEKLFDSYADKHNSASSEEVEAIPAYTMYNNLAAHKGDGIQAEEEQQGNSLVDWFGSWFGFNRRTKKIGSTTASPLLPPAITEEPGWLDSWFNFGSSSKTTTEASFEDYDNDDDDNKWFFGWFDSKPKTKRKRDTTTTTTTSLPQVPILTIVDPMRNPQNWIGILAHHIINSTATSTQKPLIEASTRATTTTTTQNPDIPRKISYEKHQIWRLKPQDDTQVRTLEEYKWSDEGVKLHWLKGPSLRGLNDVLVSPRMLLDFEATLSFESIAHEVLIFDVGKAIAYEKYKEQYFYTTTHRPTKHHKNPPLTMSWNNYYKYDDIIKYLETIRMRHPQMIELIHIGRSYEGRPLIIVKIESKQVTAASAAASVNRKKLKYKKKSGLANAVFIEAGTHGMEWIGPATSTWMINELLRLMKNNKTSIEQEFIKKTTWYILPVLNPDGYVYTHEYDRFWKKSRSRHISRPGGIITSAMTWLQQGKTPERVCYGVDLDRNWNYQWGRRGSSKSPCNDFFAGPVPFSEPETKALSEFLLDYRKQIKLYISLQAYGQVLSYPNRANSSYNYDKMDDFLDVAIVSTDGLRKKGTKSRYKIDSTSDLMAKRSGCSDAFAAYEVGIPFAYTVQLADNGVHGYLLPSSSIETTARDAFEVITAMVDYI